MTFDGKTPRPILFVPETGAVRVIDQRRLPHELVFIDLTTVEHAIDAIRAMAVRGAPLIGVTGAYGVHLTARTESSDQRLIAECSRLKAARPTAVNLEWAVDRVLRKALAVQPERRAAVTLEEAERIAGEEIENCRLIGEHGCELIRSLHRKKNGKPVNILTHCNAGWLACIEHGTATAPMYAAYDSGTPIHVWVDETRPLNQGARLTAWELGMRGVPHMVITDNAGGHLMQRGMVDMVIVGSDRATFTGDAANKIGTYLKALAAQDNGIPFYVALPSSSFDWSIRDGVHGIAIEERDPDEVRYVRGMFDGRPADVLVPPSQSPAVNYAFDVTPARLITGFITERGICHATEDGILELFPEKKPAG